MKIKFCLYLLLLSTCIIAQNPLQWKNVDSAYGPLPKSVHVYYTESKIDTAPFRAYYVIADLKDKDLDFTTDTSKDRRLKPSEFYNRNGQPLVVVNGTFFSFETNRNLNVVIKDKKLVSYNSHNLPGRGKDTFTYRHPVTSAIGISKKRTADVAWVYADKDVRKPLAFQTPVKPLKDSNAFFSKGHAQHSGDEKKWKMKTAIGGGPVLVQCNEVRITNNEELKFAGKAINDKHPRTAMGYTFDDKLIILVVEGRNHKASGATLTQLAEIMRDLQCAEALNLDGGGSSCMLVNGKETIAPSDKTQRAVPAVFMIR